MINNWQKSLSKSKDQEKKTLGASSSMPRILAIGGGKGGIGKSFISTNLAVSLARLGRSVTIVDLDLGGANLHTCLGLKEVQTSLSDYLCGRVQKFEDLCLKTEVPQLKVIAGFTDSLNIANIGEAERTKILGGVRELTSDIVILDLGAGTAEHTLDFFLAAESQLIVITPEPTSIENAYRFLKAAFYFKLRNAERDLGIRETIAKAMDQKNDLGIRTPADLVKYIMQEKADTIHEMSHLLKSFNIQLVMNQARTRADVDLGYSVKSVCKKYFGVHAEFIGAIDYDNAAWQSLRRRRPVVLEYPGSSIVAQLLRLTKTIISPQPVKEVI